jgi:hypothetical protein
VLWNVASACFPLGALLFGVANARGGVLSRWASVIFAVGLLAMAPVVAVLDAPRLAALPIGFGLAWLGYSLLTRRSDAAARMPRAVMSQPGEAGVA